MKKEKGHGNYCSFPCIRSLIWVLRNSLHSKIVNEKAIKITKEKE